MEGLITLGVGVVMKNNIDRASGLLVFPFAATLICLHFFARKPWSDLQIPVSIAIVACIFCGAAYGSKPSIIPKPSAKVMFWISLLAVLAWVPLFAYYGR